MNLHLMNPETFRPNLPLIWCLVVVFAILLVCILAMWIILLRKRMNPGSNV